MSDIFLKSRPSAAINLIDISPETEATLRASVSMRKFMGRQNDLPGYACIFRELLSPMACAALSEEISNHKWVAAGIDGYKIEMVPSKKKGSDRISIWSPSFSNSIFDALYPFYPKTRSFDSLARTDFDNYETWNFIGVNPLMRLIRYSPGGILVPHYDAPHIFNEKTRTLASLLIVIEASGSGGTTRFFDDGQNEKPHHLRNYDDYKSSFIDKPVIYEFKPVSGQAIIFDHRLLHEGMPIMEGSKKLLLRTDLVFEKA